MEAVRSSETSETLAASNTRRQQFSQNVKFVISEEFYEEDSVNRSQMEAKQL
jgi:hypothetical protein